MSSYASTASNTPQSVSGSLLPPSSVASSIGTVGDVDPASSAASSSFSLDEPSLAEREARLAALLAESELAHAELSERMMDVYEKQGEKLTMLRIMEKTLSSQAGSLLKRLQSEEQSTSQLSGIIKRYKSEHKKLLAKIANPKWEIAHHYHMTCIEHQLGHRQPHVLDVAELLPGHLRIYSLARVSSLYKRALMYYSSKSKSDRNSVSESIQESYKRLREVRKEMKEIQRMMDLMKVHMKKVATEDRDREASGVVKRIPKMERQDSGERTFDPSTPPTDQPTSPLASAASADSVSFATAAPSASSSGRPLLPSGGSAPRPGSAGGSAPGGRDGPGGMDAMMRQRRRMLGMGGPGGPGGGPGQSSRGGPGIGSGRPSSATTQQSSSTFMSSGTPVSGSSSSGATKPDSNSLAPLNPDAIVLPTDGTSFSPLATTPTAATTASSSSSLATSQSSSSSSSSSSSQSNYRMKYFKTLNLAPKLDFLSSHLPSTSPAEQRKDMAESYNMDMKGIHGLLHSLEEKGKESKEKAQQLSILQQYRKRMGVESLPQPHFDAAAAGSTSLGALDAPASPGMSSMHSEMSDSDNEGEPSSAGGPRAMQHRASSPLNLAPYSPGSSPAMQPVHSAAVGGAQGGQSAVAGSIPQELSLEALEQQVNSMYIATSPGQQQRTTATTPTTSAHSTAHSSSRHSSAPMTIEPRASASTGFNSSGNAATAAATSGSSSSNSASRSRERDQRQRERSKTSSSSSSSAAAAAAPAVTLFSSRGAGGAKGAAPTTPPPAAATATSESQPAAHGHPGDRPRAHSSRAISSRGVATNRADEHGR